MYISLYLFAVGMILGTVGTVVSLAVAAVVSLWCRHKQKRKFAASLKSVSLRISSLLEYHFESVTPKFARGSLKYIACSLSVDVYTTLRIILIILEPPVVSIAN